MFDCLRYSQALDTCMSSSALRSLPRLSLGQGKVCTISSTDPPLLFLLSACHRAVGRKLAAASVWLRRRGQSPPSALAASSPATEPRRHTPVCCCLLCEAHGSGEPAMRAARGDYRSSRPRPAEAACDLRMGRPFAPPVAAEPAPGFDPKDAKRALKIALAYRQ